MLSVSRRMLQFIWLQSSNKSLRKCSKKPTLAKKRKNKRDLFQTTFSLLSEKTKNLMKFLEMLLSVKVVSQELKKKRKPRNPRNHKSDCIILHINVKYFRLNVNVWLLLTLFKNSIYYNTRFFQRIFIIYKNP